MKYPLDVRVLGPQLWVLFESAVEPLEVGGLLEEAGH